MENIVVIVLTAVVCFAAVHPLPIPSNNNSLSPTIDQQNVCVQDVVCAVEKLESALTELPNAGLHQCPPLSCETENSDVLANQAIIVDSYIDYILSSSTSILENFAFSDHLTSLLSVINATLPTLQVNSTQASLWLAASSFQPNIPVCPIDAAFQSNCTVHLLKESVHHLLSMWRGSLPNCSYCKQLKENVRSEVEELKMIFNGQYVQELIPNECRQQFSSITQMQNQLEVCVNPSDLQGRLVNLTLWLSDTLPLLSHALPEVEALVETLSSSVLPSTRTALDGFERQGKCTGREQDSCLSLERCDVLQRAQVLAGCFPEPELGVVVHMLSLMQTTFSFFYDSLSAEEILQSSCGYQEL